MVICKNESFIMKWVKIRIVTINNMYQYVDLITMSMHGLYLIFHLKRIIFNKVHNGHRNLFGEGKYRSFELLFLPP
jgi:hypothetical protein